mmetsp:Transcript_15708/g.43333  ORF Transcript_15708/g.43333 Transcript_15708/m.43333 type:complete len:262 (-) Transcript_15708:94-879(-)|eukprot:CAMPEP_0168741190 /NCGR_PEP_ID=MMETSP0724-20121128/12377_1 /TAXON_ID=265536 /ORGANISM="Amphiprora sp., Strain CCMP467" /LENGTH=261 /DNA_ID=CAMNT_0008788669 /DNA_START=113 /DNA_END=898 /DNA_ORIENTATION=+
MSAAPPPTGAPDIEMGGAASEPLTADLPPEPETGKGFLKPIPETTLMERVAAITAGAAIVTALAAMLVEGGIVVILAGVLSVVVSPYAYWQQVQLTDIRALQETEAKMHAEVDRLSMENKRLAHNIDEMSESVQGLKDIGDALEVINKQQGQSVDAFRQQVEEQRNILAGMQNNLTAKIIDNLLSLAFGADQNDDQIIDPKEADDLIRHITNMSGVQVREDRFRAAISGQPADNVIDIIDNLIKDDIPEEDRMFIITQAAQ